MDVDPVRLVVKHTFLELECNGQNSRAAFPAHRRSSDSRIEYGNGSGLEQAEPSTASQPGAGAQQGANEMLLQEPQSPTRSYHQDDDEEDEDEDDNAEQDGYSPPRSHGKDDGTEQETREEASSNSFGESESQNLELDDNIQGLITRRGSLFSSVAGSRRNSWSKDNEQAGPDAANAGVDLEHPVRRKLSTCSVITDPGDFFLSSMCSPWAEREPPAPLPLPSMPAMLHPHMTSPQYAGPAAAPQHMAVAHSLPVGSRGPEPPAGYPGSGAFSVGFPSLQAPPGLSEDSLARSFGRQPAQVPPTTRQMPQQIYRHPPPPQPQQVALATALGASSLGHGAALAGSLAHPDCGPCYTASNGAGAGWAQERSACFATPGGASSSASWAPDRGACYSTGGGASSSASWAQGYYGPVGWQQPMPRSSQAMPPQHMEAGCRSAALAQHAGGYMDPAYGVPQQMRAQASQANNRTTVMLRNLPEGFSRNMLLKMLDDAGFLSLYDFVYMPMNFRTKTSFGYAFVNMVAPHVAQYCHDHFQGFKQWGVPTDKVCEVSWSDMHQGLTAHIHRYRNSPVMHESVPDEYKPVMYSRGIRVPFPPPTKKLRVPRIRRSPDGFGDGLDDDDDGF